MSPNGLLGLRPLLFLLGLFAQAGYAQSLVEEGEYVLRVSGCVACHTDIDNDGAYLAGGVAFNTPFGTFYSPNITSDDDYGIGRWSRQQFTDALTKGEGPGGVHYYPVFPFTAYSGMKQEDIDALFTYLRTVPAVPQPNRTHDVPWYLQFRIVNQVWKFLFFEPKVTPVDRGEYLVKILGHCDECHTPRGWFGDVDYDQHLTGTEEGPDGEPVPNITPDRETGIGRWGKSELIRYFRNGMLPDRDFVGGLMAEVIDEGLKYLRPEDSEGMAIYLKGLEPVEQARRSPR